MSIEISIRNLYKHNDFIVIVNNVVTKFVLTPFLHFDYSSL